MGWDERIDDTTDVPHTLPYPRSLSHSLNSSLTPPFSLPSLRLSLFTPNYEPKHSHTLIAYIPHSLLSQPLKLFSHTQIDPEQLKGFLRDELENNNSNTNYQSVNHGYAEMLADPSPDTLARFFAMSE